MPKSAVMNGVAHDIAHHAQSGLSWLYPHLAKLVGRWERQDERQTIFSMNSPTR